MPQPQPWTSADTQAAARAACTHGMARRRLLAERRASTCGGTTPSPRERARAQGWGWGLADAHPSQSRDGVGLARWERKQIPAPAAGSTCACPPFPVYGRRFRKSARGQREGGGWQAIVMAPCPSPPHVFMGRARVRRFSPCPCPRPPRVHGLVLNYPHPLF